VPARVRIEPADQAQEEDVVTAAVRGLAPDAQVAANIANNHGMDAGVAGWHGTAELLGLADVWVTGLDTLATIVALGEGRDSIAVIGFSASQAGPDPRIIPAVRRHVSRAASVLPRVVVTMHMGAEGAAAQRTPDQTER
jgi:hypothetical protein